MYTRPDFDSSVGGENGTAAISEEVTGDYAAEEGPGDGDIPSVSAISRDEGGPHQANIVLVDSGPASSLFGITEHKVRGNTVLPMISFYDIHTIHT